MRKHMSVFMLFIRGSLLPTIVISLLMAATQIGFYFYFGARKCMLLENMIENTYFQYFFMGFAAVMMVELCKACTGRRAKPVYTLNRLNLKPAMVFVWQSVSNILMWLVFFSAQIFTMLFISAHYASVVGEDYATSQSMMLAFYRSNFLHSLLPMEETSRWIRNGVYILAMGIFCANSSRKLRLGKLAVVLPTLAFAFTALTFVSPMGEGGQDVFCTTALVIVAAIVVVTVFAGGEEIEDETDEETP